MSASSRNARPWILSLLVLCGVAESRAAGKVLSEEFDWREAGPIGGASGAAGSRGVIRHSTSTGWGWGAHDASSSGSSGIRAGGTQIRFERSGTAHANQPGSHIHALFSSSGGAVPDQSVDLSRVGAAFKIRVLADASDQAVRWMIRDEAGRWYISDQATWNRRLPVSVDPAHFWAYPVSLYQWIRITNMESSEPQNGGAGPLQFGAAAMPDLTAITGVGLYVERSAGDAPLVIDGVKLSESEPIVYAPPNQATHWFEGPGGLRVGLGQLSGGVFNEMYWGWVDGRQRPLNVIPGMNGRSVNFAFRSQYHSGVWNPIQSGCHEEFGRPVDIVTATSSAGSPQLRYGWGPVAMPLWHGDGRYDFSQYEDLSYRQPYTDPGTPAHTDTDALAETGLSQADEVISDFDLQGFYEDISSIAPLPVLALRIVHEADFTRVGNSTRQFNAQATLLNGRPVIDPTVAAPDISSVLPGNQPSTATDMTRVPVIWSDRFDRLYANMKWLWIWNSTTGAWDVAPLDVFREVRSTRETLTVLTDSADLRAAGSCRGVGLYYPAWSEINQFPVVGVESASGEIVYEESRLAEPVSQFASWRVNSPPRGEKRDITANFSMRSLCVYLKGFLSPAHTLQGCHERLRVENYWIFGSPDAIRAAVTAIDARRPKSLVPAPGKAHVTAMPGEDFVSDGASGVSTRPTLRWWPGPRSESSECYLGTSRAEVAGAERGDSQHRGGFPGQSGDGPLPGLYQPADALQPGTTYYWRVDAVNPSGITRGNVWRFTTGL